MHHGDPTTIGIEPEALPLKRRRVDGRALRSERTKQLIIEAYLELLNEGPEPPTAGQIAKRAGCSVRSVFERFDDLLTLTVAATDYAFAEALARATRQDVIGSRQERLRAKVERRSNLCERWLPLWRILLHHRTESELVRDRIERIRDAMGTRLALAYRVELASLPEFQRKIVSITLEQLTDFESWGRMRERHRLSIEEARAAWMTALDRLLPPTPMDQAQPATA